MNKGIIILLCVNLVIISMSFNTITNTHDVLFRSVEKLNNLDTNNQIINKQGYILSYNELHEQPNWVFYKLFPSDINCIDRAIRKNKFKEDYSIPTGSSTLSDYKGSGFDRGHLKPSADESCNQELMDETFLMSNMSPQSPGFNRGIWKYLESHVRSLINENDSLYVYTAGVLSDDLSTIGVNKVSVPKCYYKILYIFNNGNIKTESYLIPNIKCEDNYDSYLTDISIIEDTTGLDFPDVSVSFTLPK